MLGFCAGAWLVLVLILLVAPEVYDQSLNQFGADRGGIELAFLVILTAFLTLLAVGVIRGWRWMFWLVLVAFGAGPLRVVASALEVAGVMPAQGPIWYAVVQAVIGVVQFAIAMAMLAGYRKHGTWGAF
ncbi:MAG TPA: hypothetical protein VGK42_11830 [Candidatus Dormibacteraeota bacterium]